MGSSGAAASLTDPSRPFLAGEPRPRSAHGGEAAAQVGDGDPRREKSRAAPPAGCERPREGSGRAPVLKEVGGCNLEGGAGERTFGCPPFPHEHPQSLPEICVFPPARAGRGRRERGKVQRSTPKPPFVQGGHREAGRSHGQGRAEEQSPRAILGLFHIPLSPLQA